MKTTLPIILMAFGLPVAALATENHATQPQEQHAEHNHDQDHQGHGHAEDKDEHGHSEDADLEEHEEEGRSRISPQAAQENGIETAIAGPGTLQITRRLTGRVHVDPGRVSRLRARYPGVIESVGAQAWTQVSKGQVLARIESNDSLQSYALKAPIGGWVVNRAAQVGEITGEEPLFVIANLDELWVELDVFDHDLEDIVIGQPVMLYDLHGQPLGRGQIDQLSPLAIHTAQSVRARVVVSNPHSKLRPGQYVRGEVIVERRAVDLLLPRSAMQNLDGAVVAFEQHGDDYEARQLSLGATDADAVEVVDGLRPGAQVVVGNSYLIKADIEKSGAAHEH